MTSTLSGKKERKAVRITAERYPYLCVQLRLGPEGFYYDPNPSPVAVINTSEKIRLNSEEKAFLRQLKENGISYMTLKTMPNDISEFPMPV